MIDCAAVMFSGIFAYWLFTNTQTLYDDTLRVFNTMVCFTLPSEWFVHFRLSAVFLIYLMATLIMWATRVFVKTLYDAAFSDTRAMRILLYGAMQGGVGLAKSIRNQRPRRYVVKGFISHMKQTKHQEILGEPVYSVCESLAEIIQQNDIEAVLVAPYRVNEFRNNQKWLIK